MSRMVRGGMSDRTCTYLVGNSRVSVTLNEKEFQKRKRQMRRILKRGLKRRNKKCRLRISFESKIKVVKGEFL